VRQSLFIDCFFEVTVLKDGIRRKVHTTEWISPAVGSIEFASDRFDPISSAIIGAAIEVQATWPVTATQDIRDLPVLRTLDKENRLPSRVAATPDCRQRVN
jgi:hypothetical protein